MRSCSPWVLDLPWNRNLYRVRVHSYLGEAGHEYRRGGARIRRLNQGHSLLRSGRSNRDGGAHGGRLSRLHTSRRIRRLLDLWRDKSRASRDVKRLALDHVTDIAAKIAAMSAVRIPCRSSPTSARAMTAPNARSCAIWKEGRRCPQNNRIPASTDAVGMGFSSPPVGPIRADQQRHPLLATDLIAAAHKRPYAQAAWRPAPLASNSDCSRASPCCSSRRLCPARAYYGCHTLSCRSSAVEAHTRLELRPPRSRQPAPLLVSYEQTFARFSEILGSTSRF